MGKRKNLEIGLLLEDKPWVEQVIRYLPLYIDEKRTVHIFISIFSVVTVRGMMYYREALKLQAFLDMAEDEGEEHWIFIIVWTVIIYSTSFWIENVVNSDVSCFYLF